MTRSSGTEAVGAEPLEVDLGPSFALERDVLVLAGDGAATVDDLLARGVRRIIVYLPPEASGSPDARVRTVRSEAELWDALVTFDPPPQTILLRRVPGSGISEALHQDLANALQKAVLNRQSYADRGGVWVRHSLRNMRHLAERPPVSALNGAFRQLPCVIVSPGPSLAKNVEQLRQLKGRAILLAGNRSVAPLKKVGISPDLVLVADPLDLRYQFEGGLLDDTGALLLDLIAHPLMYELKARRYFTFTSVHEVFDSTFGGLGQGGFLQSGGSVATTAFQLALELGCDPVLFVGQDLALSGGNYYVASAPDGATRVSVSNGQGVVENSSDNLSRAVQELGGAPAARGTVQQFIQVRGWDGEPVFTSLQFDAYRCWLESAAASVERPVRIVNCTEGGAYIQSMEHQTLARTILELDLKPIDIEGILDAAIAAFKPRKLKKPLERQIMQMQLALNSALNEASRCETLVGQLKTSSSASRNLDKSEKKMRDALIQAPFVTAWASADIDAARRTSANATSLEETVRASRVLYSVVKDSAQGARSILSDSLRHIRASGA